MTTTTTLTPGRLAALRKILEIRESALRDLQCVPTSYPAWRAEWVADRVRDLDWANRYLERQADGLGMDPAELIRAIESEGAGS